MSDDFGTVNVSKADRAREIEALRQQYARHRDALHKLIADAPTEHLSTEYRRLLGEVDAAMLKVDELGVTSGLTSGASSGASPRARTDAGMRPLVAPPSVIDQGAVYDDSQRDSRSRLALIAVAALIALAAIGWLIWKASSDRKERGQIVETTTTATTTTTTAVPATIAEETPATTPATTGVADVISVTPPAADYGTIRKGTRATRQFEVRNGGEEPVTIQVARSTCRCLYYEYRDLVPPKGKETVTVTIDGARAKAGELHETVKVTGKKDPGIASSFEVNATIQ
jgi:hypothetical protein